MSSGEITVSGVLSFFVGFATPSGFRCFGTKTIGLSGTLVPLGLMKFGSIRRAKVLYAINT